MTTKRLFIAINLPDDLKEKICNVISVMKKNIAGKSYIGASFTGYDNLHITLHFLGDTDESLEHILREKLAELQNLKCGAIKLRANGFGFFPHQASPRIWFLSFKENHGDSLNKLHSDIGKILSALDFTIDKRRWLAHLTLARIKFGCLPELGLEKKLPEEEFKVESFDLIESILKPTGAEYKVIERNKIN